jgi:type IV pilus assembly protein PilW
MNSAASLNPDLQRGLTLIELMVSILLSSFIMLGVLQLFLNAHTSDKVNSSMANIQENGRIALDMLKQDLRRTGYQGCASPNLPSREKSSRIFPQGAIGNLADGTTEGAGTTSDALVTRHAAPLRMLASDITAGQVTFISSKDITFSEGERYEFMLTNCEEVAIFTGVTSARSDNIDVTFNRNIDYPDKYIITSLQGANGGAPPELTGISLFEGSQFFQVIENIYDIRDDATNSNRPTLYKNNSAMIADVDNFQVIYGIVTGSDTNPNTRWVTADDLDDVLRTQVGRLQISLVVSSPNDVTQGVNDKDFVIANLGANTTLPAIADHRLRRVFNTDVDIRNRRL